MSDLDTIELAIRRAAEKAFQAHEHTVARTLAMIVDELERIKRDRTRSHGQGEAGK